MALLVVILIICLMLYVGRKGKIYRREEKLIKQHGTPVTRKPIDKQMRQDQIDELITVVLPTIRNDK